MDTYKKLEELTLPFIESYVEDLTKHDRTMIEDKPGVPFLHFTGKLGTHMVLLDASDKYPPAGETVRFLFGWADRHHILAQKGVIVRCMPDTMRQKLIMHFDGTALRQVSQKKAEEIVDAYMESVRRAWKSLERRPDHVDSL